MVKCGKVEILFGSNIEKLNFSDDETPKVTFKESEFSGKEYDRIVYALRGNTS